jgi:HTH-type transcriptional regulator / antitoxin HigA
MGTNIKNLTPSQAIHPGEILLDEIKARGIKQSELSGMIGYATSQLNEILKGKRNITPEFATLIGEALTMPAYFWLNLQANYDLDCIKISNKIQQQTKAITEWAMIKDYIPFAYFKKQQVLNDDIIYNTNKVFEIYNVADINQFTNKISQPSVAYHRTSTKLSLDEINLIGWDNLIKHEAALQKISKFDYKNSNAIIEALKLVFIKNKNTVEECVKILNKYGIKLVTKKNPDKCAVDGTAFWSNGNPAIGLSLRYNRIDYFAFTLMHEIAHIFLHLINDNQVSFIDQKTEDKHSAIENEADEFASNCLIENEQWKNFLQNHIKPSDKDFKVFAKNINTHPAIVLGRYSKETNNYKLAYAIKKDLC